MHTEVKMEKKSPSASQHNLTMIIREMEENSGERLNAESRSKLNHHHGWYFKDSMKVLMTDESFSLQTHTHTHTCTLSDDSTICGVVFDAVAKTNGWMMKMRLLTRFYLGTTHGKKKKKWNWTLWYYCMASLDSLLPYTGGVTPPPPPPNWVAWAMHQSQRNC